MEGYNLGPMLKFFIAKKIGEKYAFLTQNTTFYIVYAKK
jgi:hypothetical protein